MESVLIMLAAVTVLALVARALTDAFRHLVEGIIYIAGGMLLLLVILAYHREIVDAVVGAVGAVLGQG